MTPWGWSSAIRRRRWSVDPVGSTGRRADLGAGRGPDCERQVVGRRPPKAKPPIARPRTVTSEPAMVRPSASPDDAAVERDQRRAGIARLRGAVDQHGVGDRGQGREPARSSARRDPGCRSRSCSSRRSRRWNRGSPGGASRGRCRPSVVTTKNAVGDERPAPGAAWRRPTAASRLSVALPWNPGGGV